MEVAWSARGDRLLWIAAQGDRTPDFRFFVQASDGSGTPQPLDDAGGDLHVAGWAPDGASVLFLRDQPTGSTLERFTFGGKSEVLWTQPDALLGAALSPDGRMVAIEADPGEGIQIVPFVLETGERVAVTSAARQIAEALEEAHEKGIVHRDLKPQNVKAPLEGKVKVLDFRSPRASGHRRSGLPVLVAGLAAGRLTHRGPSLLRLSGLSRQTRAPTSTSACKGPTMIEERDDGTRRAAADRARLPRRFGAGGPRDAA